MTINKVLTSGVDSEYVLTDLAAHLRAKGWDVTELDFGQFKGNPLPVLDRLKQDRVAYITSAHTNLTTQVAGVIAPKFVELYPNYLSPLEILRYVQPAVSLYIPHDLLTPFGDTNLNEYRFLDLFDYILSPFPDLALQATLGSTAKVVQTGWIKHAQRGAELAPRTQASPAKPKVTLFISMLEHLRWRYGNEGLFDYFAPLLNENVTVKLPAWRDVEQIESIFKARSTAQVYPASGNSISLIVGSDLVLCNGASSIHAEANLMGCPTICLLDNEAVTIEDQRKKLEHLPSVLFHDYRTRGILPPQLITKALEAGRKTPAKPFDFGLIEDILSQLPTTTEHN